MLIGISVFAVTLFVTYFYIIKKNSKVKAKSIDNVSKNEILVEKDNETSQYEQL